MQIDKKEIKPITDILGLAVVDSQRLEYSIAYMMLLVNDTFDFTDRNQDKQIDDFMLSLSKKTLGRLIAKLKEFITISDGFTERLMEALDARNYLIHKFFSDQVENLMTIEGRDNALELVKEKREIIYECYSFLDPFIKTLMKLRGISPDFFMQKIDEKYEREN